MDRVTEEETLTDGRTDGCINWLIHGRTDWVVAADAKAQLAVRSIPHAWRDRQLFRHARVTYCLKWRVAGALRNNVLVLSSETNDIEYKMCWDRIPRPAKCWARDEAPNLWWWSAALSVLKHTSCRSQWPCGLDRGRLLSRIAGSNPAQVMDVCPRLSVLCCPV
jgi:hypothetical protein